MRLPDVFMPHPTRPDLPKISIQNVLGYIRQRPMRDIKSILLGRMCIGGGSVWVGWAGRVLSPHDAHIDDGYTSPPARVSTINESYNIVYICFEVYS